MLLSYRQEKAVPSQVTWGVQNPKGCEWGDNRLGLRPKHNLTRSRGQESLLKHQMQNGMANRNCDNHWPTTKLRCILRHNRLQTAAPLLLNSRVQYARAGTNPGDSRSGFSIHVHMFLDSCDSLCLMEFGATFPIQHRCRLVHPWHSGSNRHRVSNVTFKNGITHSN